MAVLPPYQTFDVYETVTRRFREWRMRERKIEPCFQSCCGFGDKKKSQTDNSANFLSKLFNCSNYYKISPTKKAKLGYVVDKVRSV